MSEEKEEVKDVVTIPEGQVPMEITTTQAINAVSVKNDFLMAGYFFESGMFPQVRSIAGAFTVVQYGKELGIEPVTALNNIAIINGKPAVNGQLQLTKALQKGVKIQVLLETEVACQILFKREGCADYVSEFNISEAKKAGLMKPNGNYFKYPKDMLYWRTITRGLRRIAPDVTHGLYTVEELTDGVYRSVEELPIIDITHKEEIDTEEVTLLGGELFDLTFKKVIPEDKLKGFEYFSNNKQLHNEKSLTRWIEDFKTFEDKEEQDA